MRVTQVARPMVIFANRYVASNENDLPGDRLHIALFNSCFTWHPNIQRSECASLPQVCNFPFSRSTWDKQHRYIFEPLLTFSNAWRSSTSPCMPSRGQTGGCRYPQPQLREQPSALVHRRKRVPARVPMSLLEVVRLRAEKGKCVKSSQRRSSWGGGTMLQFMDVQDVNFYVFYLSNGGCKDQRSFAKSAAKFIPCNATISCSAKFRLNFVFRMHQQLVL